MSIADLPWTAVAAAAAALAAGAGALRWRAARARRDGGADAAPHPAGGIHPEQKALLQAASEVRSALDKQSRQMEALRAFWSQRLDALDGSIGALSGAGPRPGHPAAEAGGSAAPVDPGTYGAESLRPAGGETGRGAEAAWSPGPGDQPVEVRDGVLVISRSLPPAGYLSAAGAGAARVYLNPDVQLTEFSLPRWAAFFDLQGARPYAAYRTRRPAAVRWDEGTGRGELVDRGLAEAI